MMLKRAWTRFHTLIAGFLVAFFFDESQSQVEQDAVQEQKSELTRDNGQLPLAADRDQLLL